MEHDPELIEEWARHVLEEQIACGRPPSKPGPWLTATKRDLSRHSPDYVQRVVAGLRAKKDGRRWTGWRMTRGTHGIAWDPDPNGTDAPPWL